MKLFSISPFLVAGALAAGACCCDGPKSRASTTEGKADAGAQATTASVERNYLVKGMTCGGCVFGVKKALKRAGLSSDQIVEVDHKTPDPDNKIGHAKVRFPKDLYKGQETDCRIVKEIRENPGYLAYWDAKNTDPCGLDSRKN